MLDLQPTRTNNDSIHTSLSSTGLSAKSALYKIYSNGDINTDMDNTDLYNNLNDDINKRSINDNDSNKQPLHSSIILKWIYFLIKIGILLVMGNCYFLILESIDVGKKIQLPSVEEFELIFIVRNYILKYFPQTDFKIATSLNNGIIGILLGTIDSFLFDTISKHFVNTPKRSTYEYTTIIRSLVAITGIAYGLKTLEWESSLQASLAWSLLNPCLWILLDGSIYGFIVDSILSILLCFTSYKFDPIFQVILNDPIELWNKLLWIGSSGFVGLLIFGKIGRYLFE